MLVTKQPRSRSEFDDADALVPARSNPGHAERTKEKDERVHPKKQGVKMQGGVGDITSLQLQPKTKITRPVKIPSPGRPAKGNPKTPESKASLRSRSP